MVAGYVQINFHKDIIFRAELRDYYYDATKGIKISILCIDIPERKFFMPGR